MKNLLLAVCMAAAAPAVAQDCRPLEEMTAYLVDDFGEAVVFTGLDNRGFMVALFFNPETLTWTYLHVTPNGVACIIAAGEPGFIEENVDGQPL